MDIFGVLAWLFSSFAIGILGGVYLGKRGVAGIESDVNDLKLDIAHIKGKLTPTPVISTVAHVPDSPSQS